MFNDQRGDGKRWERIGLDQRSDYEVLTPLHSHRVLAIRGQRSSVRALCESQAALWS